MSPPLLADQVSARLLPVRRTPRFSRSIDFAALPPRSPAPGCSSPPPLHLWGAQSLHTDAELLAAELVRHSLHTCGVIDKDVRLYQLDHLNLIHVRLLGYDRTIGIQVWGNATEPAHLPYRDLPDLGLVDVQATDWGSTITPQGRLTWAELAVYERTQTGLPRRPRTPSPQPRGATHWPMPHHDHDFLARVRKWYCPLVGQLSATDGGWERFTKAV